MEASGELLGIKLYGFYKPTDSIICYGGTFDLYSIGYFKRGTVKEFLEFAGRNLAKVHRNAYGPVHATVQEQEGSIHLYGDESKKIIVVAFTQGEYKARIIHKMLTEIVNDFRKMHPEVCENVPEKDLNAKYPFLKETLKLYKKPENMDKITQIDGKLSELKIIMHENLKTAFANIGDMEELVQKSEELSSMSKMFYKETEKTDERCCIIQ